jgi:hypothetical protein
MSESSIFLEQIKRIAVIAMFADDKLMEKLTLKGGNALDLVYGISTRASIDLDLSINGILEPEEDLKARIQKSLEETFREEAKLIVIDVNFRAVPPVISEDRKSFWGDWKIEFKLVTMDVHAQYRSNIEDLRRRAISVGKGGSTKFKIDLSNHEYCDDRLKHDFEGYSVFVYSPGMLVCEKIRAICQQMPEYADEVQSHSSARARDFLDIHTVAEHFSIDFECDKFHDLLRKTFDAKKVPLHLVGCIQQFRDFHASDFVSVKDTVKPGVDLNEFDFYFEYLVEKCKLLETLWNK